MPAVDRVDVEARPGGGLSVSWTTEGGPIAVDLATGPSPDHLDHAHRFTVEAGVTSVDLASSDRFVSVSPVGSGPAVVGGVRRLPFAAATNFRDLGGYRTASGRRVRWGRVFRADSLHRLAGDDLVLYEQLGMKRVFDLRGEQERSEKPNPFDSVAVPISGRPAGESIAVIEGLSSADGEKVLEGIYVGALEHSAELIGGMFRAMAAEDVLPAVFHCAAGKDRTGVVAALLLEAVGVDRGAVLDDYELTARYRARSDRQVSFERLIAAGLSPEAAAGVLTTPRWAMESALSHLDDHYGGIEAWLTGPAGMTVADVGSLRDRLLDR